MQQDDKQVHKIFYVLNNFNRSKLPSDQFINWKKNWGSKVYNKKIGKKHHKHINNFEYEKNVVYSQNLLIS